MLVSLALPGWSGIPDEYVCGSPSVAVLGRSIGAAGLSAGFNEVNPTENCAKLIMVPKKVKTKLDASPQGA